MNRIRLIDQLRNDFGFDPPPPDDSGVRWAAPAGSDQQPVSYPEDGIDLLQVHAEASWWIDHRAQHVVALLRDAGVEQLVDIGAGSGVMDERLNTAGITTLSIEPHYSGAAGIARRGLDVFCGTVENVRFPDSSLPAVGLFDVLEHLPASHEVLREVRRIIAPDGLVVVTVPAHSWLWGEEDDYAGHHRRYNRSLLIEEMAAANFSPLYTSHLFVSLVPLALLARRAPYLLGIRQGEAKMQEKLSRGLDPNERLVRVIEFVLRAEDALQRRTPLRLGLSVVGLFKPS